MTKSKSIVTADGLQSSIDNICVPIGLIDAVQGYLEILGLSEYLNGLKSKGIGTGSLTAILISFGMSEDNSMKDCAR
ncbi:MAG: hypothetical protein WCR17_02715 [Candidatus Methanomethylophilaceae archaeon]